MMKKIISSIKKFIKDDSGMEMLQVAIIIIVAAGLAGAIVAMVNSKVAPKLTEAEGMIDSIGTYGGGGGTVVKPGASAAPPGAATK